MSLHLKAEKEDISEKILLPGDPMRAKSIAESFLKEPFCYNQVRGMLGYTGNYKGKSVSVQGTGMGMPSITIYLEELVREYQVKTLIRTGTCGAIDPTLELGDIIIASSASSDSAMVATYLADNHLDPHCSAPLLERAKEIVSNFKEKVIIAPVFSSDFFYHPDPEIWKSWAKRGAKAIEMETAALYMTGLKYSVECISILTVSDCIPSGKRADTETREKGFMKMAEIALEL